ncbi:MAG: hypothetical protein V9H69_23970 [Anaerolineae bacterium]
MLKDIDAMVRSHLPLDADLVCRNQEYSEGRMTFYGIVALSCKTVKRFVHSTSFVNAVHAQQLHPVLYPGQSLRQIEIFLVVVLFLYVRDHHHSGFPIAA